MLTIQEQKIKRVFDIILSIIGLLCSWWIILIAWIVASIETRSNGLFIQKRVGKNANLFSVYKIKTMKKIDGLESTITTSIDSRITKSGAFFRNTKIDELPQLFNVLIGTMSFVGPRPDVEGYADKLKNETRDILSISPGITGPSSLKYKNEEELLSKQKDPKMYNDSIIWPDKIKINLKYIEDWSLKNDIMYIVKTVTG